MNNPNDIISEDGAYGPQTEARLRKAPATGFAIGPSCASAHVDQAPVAVLAVDGPDRVAPMQRAHYAITVQNTTTTDWSAATILTIANGSPSQLYDAQSWSSATEIGPINTAVIAGSMAVLDVEIKTPEVTEETPIVEQLELSDGTNVLGSIQIALTVTPDGGGTSSDSSDTESDTVSGGCSAGGGGAGLGLSLLALALIRRRRPTS
jgi:uncharacterized protein (TIGR03382 family)